MSDHEFIKAVQILAICGLGYMAMAMAGNRAPTKCGGSR